MKINVKVHSPHDYAPKQMRDAGFGAMDAVTLYLKRKIQILTPIWRGGLRESVDRSWTENGGWVGFHDSNIVAKVFETGGVWSRMPPYEPIKNWAQEKIALTGKALEKVVWQIRMTIWRDGIYLPTKLGDYGMMVKRTRQSTSQMELRAIWTARFRAELRQTGFESGKFAGGPEAIGHVREIAARRMGG